MPRYPIIQQSMRCVGVSVFTFVYAVSLLHVRMWVNTVVHNFVYLCHKNRAEFLLACCLGSNRKLNLLLFYFFSSSPLSSSFLLSPCLECQPLHQRHKNVSKPFVKEKFLLLYLFSTLVPSLLLLLFFLLFMQLMLKIKWMFLWAFYDDLWPRVAAMW